jgi:aconitate hydratase
MVNGLGVLAWGVGGIEAEAALLGQPFSMLIPEVIGVRLEGALPEGATATDLVLTITELLRKKGVVGKFVEFFGPGLASLALADRATIGNMSPEYGATCAIFPPDALTLDYLRFTGRSPQHLALVEAYLKAQGLFHDAHSPEPKFTDTIQLNLATVAPSVAGPKRPQDRIPLARVKTAFAEALPDLLPPARKESAGRSAPESHDALRDGAVVIAAITSCTNTSNPSVMLAAGLLARKAVARGLRRQPWVKTSLAPGSRVVTRYLEKAGLTAPLNSLGFHLAGYGCTTCIGNSGPLEPAISQEIQERDLVVASVLSGNRNFEGRIHPEVRANFLMSPPLVVAYSLVGRMDWDPYHEPLGHDPSGEPVFLRDLWPTTQEIEAARAVISSEMYQETYRTIFEGDERWHGMDIPSGNRFAWDEKSTYVRKPPYFENMPRIAPQTRSDIVGARVIAFLGDSITTDHISPAGSIKAESPAGRYLQEHGIPPADFNSYGSRRGNHDVMVRGTFANARIRNRLAPNKEGGFTTHLPSGQVTSIFEASQLYQKEGIPLCILAGKEYGSGSSRDWAAKGPQLQGVAFVIAESYERIHRANLVGMGILPLQFAPGESADSLGFSGRETFAVLGLEAALRDQFRHTKELKVRVTAEKENGGSREIRAFARIDTPQEVQYYLHGGILPFVLRQLLDGKDKTKNLPGGLAAIPQANPQLPPRDESVQENSEESFPASDSPTY